MSSESIDRPTVAQMFELARDCVQLGKGARNSLRRDRITTPHTISDIPKNGLTFSTDYLTPPDQRYYDFIYDVPLSVSRKYIGRIALARDKSWSLHMKEINLVYDGLTEKRHPKLVDANHSAHWFRWTGERVLRAERRTRFVDLEESLGENYQPDSLDGGAFAADFMATVGQFATVTAGDCEKLIQDIRAFNEELHVAA